MIMVTHNLQRYYVTQNALGEWTLAYPIRFGIKIPEGSQVLIPAAECVLHKDNAVAVERLAKHMWESRAIGFPWESVHPKTQAVWREDARNAIKAIVG